MPTQWIRFRRPDHAVNSGSDPSHHGLGTACGRHRFSRLRHFGAYLPPPWTHHGYQLDRLVGHMYITLEGIFGVPLDVAATFIILFTIYGAVLEFSKAGRVLRQFFLSGHWRQTRRRRAHRHARIVPTRRPFRFRRRDHRDTGFGRVAAARQSRL